MAIKKRPVSPRQKMINLMYVVLMAMLALNISTEVLNGFTIVEESLDRTTANSSTENEAIYGDFKNQMASNPEKVRAWFEKATEVKRMSDSLYNFAQELKVAIVKEADGPKGDLGHIENTDNLDAAGTVMLAPITERESGFTMPSILIVNAFLPILPIQSNARLLPATLLRWCPSVPIRLARTGKNTCLRTCRLLLL